MDILINKSSNIEDLFPIFNLEMNKKEPEPIFLKIDYAKHFPMERTLRLGELVSCSNLEVHAMALGDIDFTEFVFAALCNTATIHIPGDYKINMVSLVPVTKVELTKIAKLVSLKTSCKAEDVVKGYENKSTIDPADLLTTVDDFMQKYGGKFHDSSLI